MTKEYADNSDSHLPPYELPERGCTSNDRRSERSRTSRGEDDEPSRSGGRGSYAMKVQRACSDALRIIKEDNQLATSSWAEPLKAAPAAVVVMAFLMKTAANPAAAGLTVSSLTVTDDDNNVIGQLKSKYFNTNLQNCSDVGRMAFLDAEIRMNKINATARSMMEDGGSISYIVELLEDPEDAQDNLKPEIEEVKQTAIQCRQDCEAITKKFTYWQHLINHLSTTALDLQDRKIELKKEVKRDIGTTTGAVNEHRETAAKVERNIEDIKIRREEARNRTARAQDELDYLVSLPVSIEPSYYDDLHMAQKLAPSVRGPKKERGFLADTARSFIGWNSNKHHAEDVAYEEKHRAEDEQRRQKIIAEARARREAEKKLAEEKLREARAREEGLSEEIRQATKDLDANENSLLEAKSQLARANTDLKRLDQEKMEVEEILSILSESTSKLAELKKQVEPLIIFFSNMETAISISVMKQVDAFLDTISRNIKNNENNESFLHLKATSKKRVLQAALQIQGRFSIIADVSDAYVQISNKCIRPTINEMEILSKAQDGDWEAARIKFEETCEQAINDIHNIAARTSTTMDKTAQQRIGMLERKAIEANEDAAEN